MKYFHSLFYLLFICVYSSLGQSKPLNNAPVFPLYKYQPKEINKKILAKAKTLAMTKNDSITFNKKYSILIDFSIPSGYKRLFVVDLEKDSILYSCLVTHGAGPNDTNDIASGIPVFFTDTMESHASSLGKYAVMARGYSTWGINVKYTLLGLDTTNAHAMQRFIVLHSWEKVASENIYPKTAPLSWGCPAVSNYSMRLLDGLLASQKDPLLLQIFQ